MKYLANEILEKAEPVVKDRTDLEKLLARASEGITSFRNSNPFFAGSIEGAIGVAAISAGCVLLDPVDCGTKIAELVGVAFGTGVGGIVGGAVATIGGIGVAMMGTAFAIPASAITLLGAGIGALSGAVTGWFGVNLAAQELSWLEMLFDNISGAALIAFGVYMLCLAIKDLWRAGGEFITYLNSQGVNEVSVEVLS